MNKFRIEITKGEEIRYISHLDYAALIERAICRSGLPAAYSEGFNPHMKIAFASALAVGVTSDAEYMDIELVQPVCQPEFFDRLKESLPEGTKLLRAKEFEEKHKALMAEVDLAGYEIKVPLHGDLTEASEAVERYNNEAEVFYKRVTPKKMREIEVKQYMKKNILLQGTADMLTLHMRIIITSAGSIKPGEILEILKDSFGMPIEPMEALINRQTLSGGGKPLIDLV
jgi:radical SAM-linked protein